MEARTRIPPLSFDLDVEGTARHGLTICQEITTDDGAAQSQARQRPPDQPAREGKYAYCADPRVLLVGGETS